MKGPNLKVSQGTLPKSAVKTILIIEKNKGLRDNLFELLTLKGYTVLLAKNEDDGIIMAMEKLPDLILCDMVPCTFGGWEVLDILKRSFRTRYIPFIFITTQIVDGNCQKAFEMGVARYIVKPFAIDELLTEISDCLSYGRV